MIGRLARRFVMLVRGGRFHADLEEEMRLHRELREQEKIAEGLSPDEAHFAVSRKFGNDLALSERSRDMWGWNWLEALYQDIRYGLRQLRRNPGFTTVVVLTLALGIGANTAIFSLVDAAFLRSFPYPHASQLAFLWQNSKRTGETEGAVSYPNYADWQAESQAFSDMAFIMFGKEFLTGTGTEEVLSGPNGSERVPGALVSTNFFSVMDVNPMRGRAFVPDDGLRGRTDVAIISYGLWQGRFGGDPGIVGKRKDFGGEENAIIGVMPRGFEFPSGTEIWKPREISPLLRTKTRQYPNMSVIGRRKPGMTWSQAQADMDTVAARLASQYPAIDGGVGIRIVPLRMQFSERVRQGIIVLWGAIIGVLLIACLNTAGLMVGRTAARQKEIAVRLSLGATRPRLMRQLGTEALLLAVGGGSLGLVVGEWAVSLVSRLNPDIARLNGTAFDSRVLGYTAAITVFTALCAGALPALAVPNLDLNRSLKENSALSAGGRHVVRRALIVAEVSMAFALLVGSGLLIRSLWLVMNVDPGFDSAHVLTFRVYWPGPAKGPTETAARASLFKDLISRLHSVPGVTSAASSSFVLFPSEMYKVPFQIEGQPTSIGSQKEFLPHGEASPGFFRTMGIPVLSGRTFTGADCVNGGQPVAVVSRTMAARYWPNESAIGKRFRLADPNFKSPWFTIVGVVGDVREEGLESSPGLMAYFPADFYPNDDIVARTRRDPGALAAAVRNAAHALDKNLVIGHLATGESMLAQHESQRWFDAFLLGGFAFIALALAAIGIYGMLAYWVGQRTQEIGVRMALGAQPDDVFALVVGHGFRLAVAGIGIGMATALALTRFLASLLFGVRPTDPLTFIAVSLILISVALLACYIPARRAAKVDPMVALRYE